MESETQRSPDKLAIVVIGSDTLIEALPVRPIQLANACGALGFDLAVPLSWGDELVAEAALRDLEAVGPAKPRALCCCPLVRRRLLQTGGDLADSLLSLVSPPVAVAKHLRATLGNRLGPVTFVGSCPDAMAPDYDNVFQPQDFLRFLKAKGIEVASFPDYFVDRIPADRRRFVSLPGGCPSPEVLWQRCNGRSLAQLEGPDFPVELAQHLLSSQSVLVDPATAVGCSCSGVTRAMSGPAARVAVTSLEPPRSTSAVVADEVVSQLEVAVDVPRVVREERAVEGEAPGRPPMAVTPRGAFRIGFRPPPDAPAQ